MAQETQSWLCGCTNSIVTQQSQIDLFINVIDWIYLFWILAHSYFFLPTIDRNKHHGISWSQARARRRFDPSGSQVDGRDYQGREWYVAWEWPQYFRPITVRIFCQISTRVIALIHLVLSFRGSDDYLRTKVTLSEDSMCKQNRLDASSVWRIHHGIPCLDQIYGLPHQGRKK